MRRTGLTLVELMVVMVIIVTLAGLIFAVSRSFIQSARSTTTKQRLDQVVSGLQTYAAEQGLAGLMRSGLWYGGHRNLRAICGTIEPARTIAKGISTSYYGSVADFKPVIGVTKIVVNNGLVLSDYPWSGTSPLSNVVGQTLGPPSPSRYSISNGSTSSQNFPHWGTYHGPAAYQMVSSQHASFGEYVSLLNPLKTIELLRISGIMECEDDPTTPVDERDPGLPAVCDYTVETADLYPEQAGKKDEYNAVLRPYLGRYCGLRGKRYPWNDAWGNPLLVGYAFDIATWSGSMTQRVWIVAASLGDISELDRFPTVAATTTAWNQPQLLASPNWNYLDSNGSCNGMYPLSYTSVADADYQAARTDWITTAEFASQLSQGNVEQSLRRAWFTASQVCNAGAGWLNGFRDPIPPLNRGSFASWANSTCAGLPPGPFKNVGRLGRNTAVMTSPVELLGR